jgi:hypothetical protein
LLSSDNVNIEQSNLFVGETIYGTVTVYNPKYIDTNDYKDELSTSFWKHG